MNIYEILFVLQFIAGLCAFFCKLYNVMSLGKFTNIKVSIVVLCGYLISWLVALGVFLYNLDVYIYGLLFLLESLVLPIVVILFVIELFFLIKESIPEMPKAYMANTTFRG